MNLNLTQNEKFLWNAWKQANKNKTSKQDRNSTLIEYQMGTYDVLYCETNKQPHTIIINKIQTDIYGQEEQLNKRVPKKLMV
jgi:hypothetical protein